MFESLFFNKEPNPVLDLSLVSDNLSKLAKLGWANLLIFEVRPTLEWLTDLWFEMWRDKLLWDSESVRYLNQIFSVERSLLEVGVNDGPQVRVVYL